jgi:3',5'-cyclic AMP phosphodiesterase CpdA
MKRRALTRSSAAVAALLCLAVTTAWAGLRFENFDAFLDGVDYYGNLSSELGSYTTFHALVNTRSGKAIGTAKACVTNNSDDDQFYRNADFGDIFGISVCSSLYLVTDRGKAFLIAIGRLTD